MTDERSACSRPGATGASGADGTPGGAGPSSSTATTTTLPTVPRLSGLYARALRPRRAHGLAHAALPEVTYRVADVVADEAQLVAYQRLLGEPVDGTLPAGFVHVLAFPVATALMVRDDFPLRIAGMVHLSNAVTVHRTIAADERLLVHAHAENLRPHRTGTQVDLVTEVSARYGAGDSTEVVWRGVSTYLAKGTMLGEGSVLGTSEPDSGNEGSGSSTAPGSRMPAGGDSAGGRSAGHDSGRPLFVPPSPTARWHLDAATGRRYAAVSGDQNPIHLSALTAKAFGFPRAIAHGMYTASRALAQVGPARGEAFDWTVEFASPVLLPGTVDVAVSPRAHEPASSTSTSTGEPPRTRASGSAGYDVVGWDARGGRLHLTGTVVPLG